jgi:hypothetical protein
MDSKARVKKLAYLSRHLARREGCDDSDLGLYSRLSIRSLLSTMDDKGANIILKPYVRLERSAHMSSQYLCGTSRPSTNHVIHEIKVKDADGSMRTVKALIDCGASSFFISPKLVQLLGLREQTVPAYTTTRGLDGKILAHARNSRKLSLDLQYLPELALMQESDVLVVKMTSYDLVLGLPWFERYNPDIDWTRKRLINLRNPVNAQAGITDQNPMNAQVGKLNPVIALAGKTNDDDVLNESRSPVHPNDEALHIETLSAVQFESLLASAELSEAFAIRLWQGTGLLGGTEHGQGLSLNLSGKYTCACVAS